MSQTAHIDIPQDILDSSRLSLQDIKQELALTLYAQGRLSLGKAREFAGLTLVEFRQILAFRHIPANYGEDELSEDLETLSIIEGRLQ
jgi:predicted HTH domain antitoxin